jgi:hypothetical protein
MHCPWFCAPMPSLAVATDFRRVWPSFAAVAARLFRPLRTTALQRSTKPSDVRSPCLTRLLLARPSRYELKPLPTSAASCRHPSIYVRPRWPRWGAASRRGSVTTSAANIPTAAVPAAAAAAGAPNGLIALPECFSS